MSGACEREAAVLEAAREERWTSGLRSHAESCPDCAAGAEVAAWMSDFARVDDREHMLPDPSLVWLKAHLLQGSKNAAAATRPLNFAQLFAYFAVAGGWAAMLTWKWSAIEAWLRSFTPAGLVSSASTAEGLSLSVLGTFAVLATMTLMLAMHTILAED